MRTRWIDLWTRLTKSFVDVVRAEIGLLGEEWKSSLSLMGKAVGLLLAAAVVVVLLVPPLLAVALLHGLTYWLPLWGAALVTAAVVLLVAAVPALMGYSWLRRWQTPVEQAKSRVSKHLDWWQDRVLEPSPSLADGTTEERVEDEDRRQASSASE